jgi:hypothetical protein
LNALVIAGVALAVTQISNGGLGFRNRIAKLFRCVNPQANCILRIAEGFLLRSSMRGASRKFRNLRYENTVFFAPVDDDFVLDHCQRLSFAFKITDRTCFTWLRLRVRDCPLQIDSLLNAGFPEQVMAAPHSLLETQALHWHNSSNGSLHRLCR